MHSPLRRVGSRRGKAPPSGDANFKIPALTLLTVLSTKGIGAIPADPFTQPEWDGNNLVNVRQATVIRSAAVRSRLNVFDLTLEALDKVRCRPSLFCPHSSRVCVFVIAS